MKIAPAHPLFVLYDRVNKKFAQGPNTFGTSYINYASHYGSLKVAEQIAKRILIKYEVTEEKDFPQPIFEVRALKYELGEPELEIVEHTKKSPSEESYVIVAEGLYKGFLKQTGKHLNLLRPVESIKEATVYSSLKRAQKSLKNIAQTEWQSLAVDLAPDGMSFMVTKSLLQPLTYTIKLVKDLLDEKLESTFKW